MFYPMVLIFITWVCVELHGKNFRPLVLPRAYRPQRHVTALVLCVPSKIQIRQWFVTNCSNSWCLDCTMHTMYFTIFSLDLNFARCLVTCPLPLWVYKPLVLLWRPFHRCFVHLCKGWSTKNDICDVFTTFFLLSYTKILHLTLLLMSCQN